MRADATDKGVLDYFWGEQILVEETRPTPTYTFDGKMLAPARAARAHMHQRFKDHTVQAGDMVEHWQAKMAKDLAIIDPYVNADLNLLSQLTRQSTDNIGRRLQRAAQALPSLEQFKTALQVQQQLRMLQSSDLCRFSSRADQGVLQIIAAQASNIAECRPVDMRADSSSFFSSCMASFKFFITDDLDPQDATTPRENRKHGIIALAPLLEKSCGAHAQEQRKLVHIQQLTVFNWAIPSDMRAEVDKLVAAVKKKCGDKATEVATETSKRTASGGMTPCKKHKKDAAAERAMSMFAPKAS